MKNLKLINTAAVLATVAVAVSACGGNGNVTLHGTFTDNADTASGSACADQGTLSGADVVITVDNIGAGNAPINWSGNPADIGTYLGGGQVLACTGTWSITVPSAQVGYGLSVTGLGGVSGSVTIPATDAGKPIVLNDSTPDGQGGNVLGEGPP